MTTRFRDARPDDAEALYRLYHDAYAAGEDPHRPAEVALTDSVDDVRAAIAEGIGVVARRQRHREGGLQSVGLGVVPQNDAVKPRPAGRGGLVLVAEDAAGRIIGSVHLRSVANVRRLAVAPDRKGEGLSHSLLEEALVRSKAEGFRWAMLDTLPTHPWLPKLYRKHGFVERCLEIFPNGVEWLQFRKRL